MKREHANIISFQNFRESINKPLNLRVILNETVSILHISTQSKTRHYLMELRHYSKAKLKRKSGDFYLRGRLIIVFHLKQRQTEEESPRTSSDRDKTETQNPKVNGADSFSVQQQQNQSKSKLLERNGKVRIESCGLLYLSSIFVFGNNRKKKKKGFGFMSFRFRFRFLLGYFGFVTRPPANVYLSCPFFFSFSLYFYRLFQTLSTL